MVSGHDKRPHSPSLPSGSQAKRKKDDNTTYQTPNLEAEVDALEKSVKYALDKGTMKLKIPKITFNLAGLKNFGVVSRGDNSILIIHL